jgi:hypothetical protein
MINHINYTFTPPSPIRFGHSEEDTLTEEDKRFFRNFYGKTHIDGDATQDQVHTEGNLLARIEQWAAQRNQPEEAPTETTVDTVA